MVVQNRRLSRHLSTFMLFVNALCPFHQRVRKVCCTLTRFWTLKTQCLTKVSIFASVLWFSRLLSDRVNCTGWENAWGPLPDRRILCEALRRTDGRHLSTKLLCIPGNVRFYIRLNNFHLTRNFSIVNLLHLVPCAPSSRHPVRLMKQKTAVWLFLLIFNVLLIKKRDYTSWYYDTIL